VGLAASLLGGESGDETVVLSVHESLELHGAVVTARSVGVGGCAQAHAGFVGANEAGAAAKVSSDDAGVIQHVENGFAIARSVAE